MVGVAKARVLVESDLAVEREHLPRGRLHQRVDLDEGGVLLDEDVPEPLQDLDDLLAHARVEAGGGDDLLGLRPVAAGERVDGDPGQRLGPLDRELLDLHAALLAGHRQVGAVRAVQQERDVVLLGDVGGTGDEHLMDDVALDVQAQDGLGLLGGLLRRGGELHATGLATAPGLHLGLDDDCRTDPLGGGTSVRGGPYDLARLRRDAVRPEEVLGLVLVQIHAGPALSVVARPGQEGLTASPAPMRREPRPARSRVAGGVEVTVPSHPGVLIGGTPYRLLRSGHVGK